MIPPSTSDRCEFDPVGFASTLARHRCALQLSTRELARRAGISQAYVVSLERPHSNAKHRGSVPTVDVVARLAHALAVGPLDLCAAALRPAGRHVLLVIEDHDGSALDHARQMVNGPVDTWIWAATSPRGHAVDRGPHLTIDLRRDATQAYEPGVIADALQTELGRLGAALAGRSVGLVFAETSSVMSRLDDPGTVLSFEHRWADVVTQAAASVGAHAAWNVCVYELSALQAMSSPIAATLDLIRSHDALWESRGASVSSGRAAARRILDRLRPAGISRARWQPTVDSLVDDLTLAA